MNPIGQPAALINGLAIRQFKNSPLLLGEAHALWSNFKEANTTRPMKFSAVPLSQAEGKILGHNVAGPTGRRALRKGKPLTAEDVARLAELGRVTIYVAELEADDVDENSAAQRIAAAAQGTHLRLSRPATGRANLHATTLGILRVAQERLLQVNMADGITLATKRNHAVVFPDEMVATLKVITYGLPETAVRQAERIASRASAQGGQKPLLHIDPLLPKNVALILSGSPFVEERVVSGFEKSLSARLGEWGSDLDTVAFTPLEDEEDEKALADLIAAQVAREDIDLIILAGETAIMDRFDIAPRAVERAGGHVTAFGAPVDPGNLLMLAYYDAPNGRSVPIVGAPGCARSPKKNIVDLVIPRLLVGDQLSKMDIVRLGLGGLLDEVRERGRPRDLN